MNRRTRAWTAVLVLTALAACAPAQLALRTADPCSDHTAIRAGEARDSVASVLNADSATACARVPHARDAGGGARGMRPHWIAAGSMLLVMAAMRVLLWP